MQLHRLSLFNYRALGNVGIVFDDITAAVITGPNGAGKSSLVEGMLWTLYGQSRSSSVDGVVRIGQTDCIGDVEFSTGGQRYRAVRKRSIRTSAGKTELDLYAQAGDQPDGWRSISEKGARATQAKIIEVAGVDYETLVASSVVMQGDAGRFTKARPEERRGILRDVLQLDRWSEWAADARAAARSDGQDAEVLGARISEALGGVDDPEAHYALLVRRGTLGATHLAEADRWIDEADAAQGRAAHSANVQREEAAALARVVVAALDRLETATDRLMSVRARHGEAAARGKLDDVEAAERKAPEVVAALEEARAAETGRRRRGELQREDASLRRAYLDTSERLRRAQDAVEAAQAREAVARTLPGLREQLATAEQAVAAHDKRGKAVTRAWRAEQAANSAAAAAELALEQAISGAALLDRAPCAVSPGSRPIDPETGEPRGLVVWGPATGPPVDLAGACPLIANAVAASGSIAGLRTEAEGGHAALVAARDEHASLSAGWKDDRPDLTGLIRSVADAEAAQAPGVVLRCRGEVDAAEAAIRDITARGKAAKAELDAIPEPPTATVADLEDERRRLDQVIGQRALREAAAQEAALLVAEIGRWTDERKGAQVEVARLRGRVRGLRRLVADADALVEVQDERARLVKAACRDTLRECGTAEDERDRFRVLLERVKTQQAEAAGRRNSATTWAATAEACALAPVLVIEKAIPALEDHANAVLAVVSSRGMRVRIDTQKTIGTGEQREALEIIVRDDVGERRYEDFSGGEQFRIDIALRLGLARLLADREGVPVSFLVIDEGGFGALDHEGIDALKEVVAGLVTQYPLVLVITHLDEVADCLPRRIQLRRDASGETTMQAL